MGSLARSASCLAALLAGATGCANGAGDLDTSRQPPPVLGAGPREDELEEPPYGARSDAGPESTTDAGAPPAPDAAAPLPAAATCAERFATPVPAALMPRCASATRTCVRACDNGLCMKDCIDADATAPGAWEELAVDCNVCVGWQQLHCLETSGCHPELAAHTCCEEACAADPDPAACAEAGCAAELDALVTCFQATMGCWDLTAGVYAGCYAP